MTTPSVTDVGALFVPRTASPADDAAVVDAPVAVAPITVETVADVTAVDGAVAEKAAR
jgi:hypothetical protein